MDGRWRRLAVALAAVTAVAGGTAVLASAGGSTLYVAQGGSDSSDCQTQASPCATIAYAVSQASDGDTVDVGPGTFPESGGVSVPFDLTIAGSDQAPGTTVAGTPSVGATVTVSAGNVNLQQLTITGATGGDGVLVSGGAATVAASLVTGNQTGVQSTGGSVSVIDSTVSANSVGAAVSDSGTVSATSATVSDNSGTGVLVSGGSASLGATIVSGDSPDCSGGVTDAGYNLDDDTTCGFLAQNQSQSGVNPELGPLQANGGPTETLAPGPTSPVLDTIPTGTSLNATTVCPGTDQRGVDRPEASVGANCDIGAVELAVPVAGAQSYGTPVNQALSEPPGSLQSGVTDANPAPSPWTAQLAAAPGDGSVTVGSDGSFLYTPDTGFVGTDAFTYTLTDADGFVSDPATVTITVSPDSSTTASQVSSNSIVLGPHDAVSDTATVTGAPSAGQPAGTVLFYWCGPTTGNALCTSTGVAAGSPALTGATSDTSTATSQPVSATQAGTYCFAAVYVPQTGGDYTASSDNQSGTVDPAACVDVSATVSGVTLQANTTALPPQNVYVSDIDADEVEQFTPVGQSIPVPTSGINDPQSVAVDGAGDVFVADTGNDRVIEVTPGGVQSTVPASGLTSPQAVAVDKAGNVYIGDVVSSPRHSSRLVRVAPNGSQSVLASSLDIPRAIAVDAAGDAYVADANDNDVVEVSPSGQVAALVIPGLDQPSGLAMDRSGDLFVADSANNRILEVTPAGTVHVVLTTGLDDPHGVAVDAAGDLYIADTGNQQLVMLTPGGTQETVASELDAGGPAMAPLASLPEGKTQALTLTATVAQEGPAAPTGTVSFYSGATLLGTAALRSTSSGAFQSTLTTTALPFGSATLRATYNGDANHLTSSATLPVTVGLPLSPSTLPSGKVLVQYRVTLTASAGRSPYHFTVSSGAPPANLTLTTQGVLSGKPKHAGTSVFTVRVTDAAHPEHIGYRTYTLVVKS